MATITRDHKISVNVIVVTNGCVHILIMNKEKKIALIFVHRRRCHRFFKMYNIIHWVHYNIAVRNELGDYYINYMDLQRYEDKFLIYFRIFINSSDELHKRLKNYNVKIRLRETASSLYKW